MPHLTEHDVACYILDRLGDTSAMKLQKLLYYSQAWSMVWDERVLFEKDFEVRTSGPVLPSIYEIHRGQFLVNKGMFSCGKAERLDGDAADTVDQVLKVYGNRTAQWLSQLVNKEAPWKQACIDLGHLDAHGHIIKKGDIHDYYAGLKPDGFCYNK